MFEILGAVLGVLGAIVVVGIFIIRTDKRPDNCTCKSYNWFRQGPVNRCSAHKHYMD